MDALRKIRAIFTAPVFEDEETTRLAGLTHFILLTILVVTGIHAAGAVFLAPERLHRLLPLVMIFPVFSIVHLVMLRRGNVRRTSLSLTGLLWLAVTIVVFTGGGIHNPGYGSNVVIVGMAALLLGGRWALVFAGLSAAAGLVMIWAESAGYIEGQTRPALSIWMTQTTYFTVAAVLIHLAARNIYQALERARANEQLLMVRNTQLEQEIRQREQIEKDNLELALERERLEAFRLLISEISHDLKTPLATINTSLYLLERLDDPQKQKEKIENIKKQTEYLKIFVQDIVTLSRLEHLAELDLTPTDGHQLLSDMEEQIRATCEEKSLQVTFALDAVQSHIRADKDELRRVILNLLDNAVNYTPPEGTVFVRTHNEADKFILEVADTGIGISEADLPRIFDRFYRAENGRATNKIGSGLGLAIVKTIVNIHAGDVAAASKDGEGATFQVRLPLIDAQGA
jgi:signal transduction histidine kinase